MAENFQNLTAMGGLVTDRPADKIEIQSASDIANIDLSSLGLIQTRKGYDRLANDTEAVGTNLRGYLFIKNFGDTKRIKMRMRDDGTNSHLEWHNPTNPDTGDGKLETLVADLTQGAVMGFATANGNNGTNSNLCVFCNGIDNFSTWSGATALVSSVTGAAITAATIAFVDSDPDTITDSGDGFVSAGFSAGDKIVVSGSTSNDGTYEIASVVAGTITLDAADELAAEGASATVTITAGTIVAPASTANPNLASEGFSAGG